VRRIRIIDCKITVLRILIGIGRRLVIIVGRIIVGNRESNKNEKIMSKLIYILPFPLY
jgi:hypothetical protein